jgi:hypothetical protein
MIDRFTPRSAILVSLFVVLLIGLLGWFVLVAPQRAKVASLEQEIAVMEVRLDTANRIKANDKPAERQIQNRKLQIAMPEQVAMPQILRQLSVAAGRAGVRIEGVTPAAPAAAAGSQAVPITLAMNGHYFGIANFLQLLRTKAELKGELIKVSGRLYSVDSISFSGTGGAGAGTIGATLALNAFTYSGAPAAAPTPLPTETADTTGSPAGNEG